MPHMGGEYPDGKYYRYRVVKATGRKPSVKNGDVLLYRRARGPTHSEIVVSLTTGRVTQTWTMEYVGPCWVRRGKVIKKTIPSDLAVEEV
jgi:hypothetical protein